MHEPCTPSVLAVGVAPLPASTPKLEVRVATAAREAIAMLRLLHFDLLLVGREIPDEPLWTLVKRVRSLWSDQRWALVATGITCQEEIWARTLGSALILDGVPSSVLLCDVVSALRQTRLQSASHGLPTAAGSRSRGVAVSPAM